MDTHVVQARQDKPYPRAVKLQLRKCLQSIFMGGAPAHVPASEVTCLCQVATKSSSFYFDVEVSAALPDVLETEVKLEENSQKVLQPSYYGPNSQKMLQPSYYGPHVESSNRCTESTQGFRNFVECCCRKSEKTYTDSLTEGRLFECISVDCL